MSSALSILINMILLFICFTPFYVSIASLSFEQYSKKMQASYAEIESFKQRVRFPTKILLLPPKYPLMYWLLGKNYEKTSLNRLNVQKVFLCIICLLLHIPLFLRFFIPNKAAETSFYSAFIIISAATMIVCARFGHNLQDKS